MKKSLLASFLILAALALAADVAAPTTTTKLNRIITYPNVSADPVAVAYYETTVTVNGVTFASPEVSVSWRLADTEKAVTITVDGKELTLPYAVVSQLVVAVADKELAAKNAPQTNL